MQSDTDRQILNGRRGPYAETIVTESGKTVDLLRTEDGIESHDETQIVHKIKIDGDLILQAVSDQVSPPWSTCASGLANVCNLLTPNIR
jgi:hypothetical protein